MFIVKVVTSKGKTLYWTGFDLSAHREDAAPYSKRFIAAEAVTRASRWYPLLKFEIESQIT